VAARCRSGRWCSAVCVVWLIASTTRHNQIITAAAREVLRPMGLKQKGRSRVWLDDHGWWLIVVEFQASSWSRGSYLNVGAMWLWHEPDHHIRFDVGHRVDGAGFIQYQNEDQFIPLARRFADLAGQEVRALRERFPDLRSVCEHLVAENPGRGWPAFNAGVALGCRVKRTRLAPRCNH
jgi:hypothetical protein